jgi:hypothetical protein
MASKRAKMTTKKNRSVDEIRRVWGDIDVVDAQKDLRVFISPEDVLSARSKDPGCCVFAQACKRQFAATKVLFWRTVAYVELPSPSGKRRVERFELSPEMRSLIENFDRGKKVPIEAGFELRAVRPSRAFEHKLDLNRKQRLKKAAMLNGERISKAVGNQGKGAYSRPAIVVDLEVRSGKGRVHFKSRKD